MLKSTRFNVTDFLITALGVFLLHDAWVASQSVAPIPYSEFQRLLREKKVKEVVITTNQVYGELTAPENGRSKFVAARVDTELSRELDQYGVKYAAQVENTL